MTTQVDEYRIEIKELKGIIKCWEMEYEELLGFAEQQHERTEDLQISSKGLMNAIAKSIKQNSTEDEHDITNTIRT